MKKIMIVCSVALALAGCHLKEMKSTPFYDGGEVRYIGDAADRVNLWPVAYWRNPVGSVAWPILSFSNDLFALRPIYSQYKQNGLDGAWDEYNLLWPLGQADLKHKDYRFFPFFWGKTWNDENYQAIFPIYWNGPKYNSLFPLWIYHGDTNHWWLGTFGGLAGAYRRTSGYRASWTFPLWFEDNEGLFATPIYGRSPDSWWLFPLWYKSESAFVSLLYAQGEYGNHSSWWAAPAALSWGSGREVGDEYVRSDNTYLLGLGSWDTWRYSTHTYGNCYAFPLIHHKWSAPTEKGRKDGRKGWSKTHALCYLTGWKVREDDSLHYLYVFPIFGWEEDGSWQTLLAGQFKGSTTSTYMTPFAGVFTGEYEGGWLFPAWYRRISNDYAAKRDLVDAPSLPECVEVSEVTCTDTNLACYGKTRLVGKSFHESDSEMWLLHDVDRSVSGSGYNSYGALMNTYQIAENIKRGNKLLFNYEFEREVSFDLKTREKLSDEEESEASLLGFLYQYERTFDRMKNEEYVSHRVLWKIWDWEEEDGKVSLDVFPGFTYDTENDGYVKISFLWRFFRYEYDPDEGRSLDFLFIPLIW